jgi:hypothetical protein
MPLAGAVHAQSRSPRAYSECVRLFAISKAKIVESPSLSHPVPSSLNLRTCENKSQRGRSLVHMGRAHKSSYSVRSAFMASMEAARRAGRCCPTSSAVSSCCPSEAAAGTTWDSSRRSGYRIVFCTIPTIWSHCVAGLVFATSMASLSCARPHGICGTSCKSLRCSCILAWCCNFG